MTREEKIQKLQEISARSQKIQKLMEHDSQGLGGVLGEMEAKYPLHTEAAGPEQGKRALETGANAFFMGYYPELKARLQKQFSDQSEEDLVSQTRERLNQFAQENPKKALVASIAGGMVNPLGRMIPAFKMGVPGSTAWSALKTGLANAGKSVPGGLAFGALYNPATQENPDLLQPEQRVGNALNSAAIGAGLTGGLTAGLPLAAQGAKKLRRAANDMAYRALTPYLNDTRKTNSRDRARSQKVGGFLLDHVLGWMPQHPDSLEGGVEAARQRIGGQIGSKAAELSELDRQALASGASRNKMGQKLRKDLLVPETELPDISARNAELEGLIHGFETGHRRTEDFHALGRALDPNWRGTPLEVKGLENYLKMTGNYDKATGIPFGKLRDMKEQVGGKSNDEMRALVPWQKIYRKEPLTPKEDFYYNLYQNIAKAEEEGASVIEQAYGQSPGNFKHLKDQYGLAQQAKGLAVRNTDKKNTFKRTPLGSNIAGAAATAGMLASGQHDPVSILKALAIGAAVKGTSKFAKDYGNQIGAQVTNTLADQGSRLYPKLTQEAQKNPQLYPILEELLKSYQGG